ncbi:hypothetical protein LTR05_006973 [Lithohypha guttulata]|uniref:Uncharacterized protein n=1 Tax=Lithohypha guttulata TaxID=1690604 RepID=A0AAN7SWU0_9EURO|nr:hypothetical protein LTR05_006973 [Lithohypha guttulata]
MSNLTDYKLLSFDVYGTLIDWETGVLENGKSVVSQSDKSREDLLSIYSELEKIQQVKTPDMPYSKLCATVYPQFAERLGVSVKPTVQESEVFGQSVGNWPAFPDTVDALRRLKKHFKLVVLSNVDRKSFKVSHAGSLQDSHFDKIITAQDVGSYKPDPKNFEYMFKTMKQEFGVEQNQILQTAQSQFHDHHPARKIKLKSVWIERRGTMGNLKEQVYDWKFVTLGDMADAVEKEVAAQFQ